MRILSPLFLFLTLLACGEPSVQTKSGRLVAEARKQIGVTTTYDGSYVALKYPNGDVPMERGVCTDVVIRALRKLDFDLQKLVHEDMKKNFSKYPRIWGLARTDKNIDHRRVPNLRRYFERRGIEQKLTEDSANFKPGDLVTCKVPGNRPHIMIVSDKKNSEGVPYVIHNIGGGASEDNDLFTYKLTGHYRWFKD
ncbi:MAG: DUF1287 domain-containing protein [Akkermansiaceae bacterium]|nr:DUF1287 domain-containing protein [Akkermansiaceae bacterium]